MSWLSPGLGKRWQGRAQLQAGKQARRRGAGPHSRDRSLREAPEHIGQRGLNQNSGRKEIRKALAAPKILFYRKA